MMKTFPASSPDAVPIRLSFFPLIVQVKNRKKKEKNAGFPLQGTGR